MNPRMWLAALRIIPRIEKSEWDKLDFISRWLIATRAVSLIMTFLSASLAALFALTAGPVNLLLYVLLAVGLVLAHGSSNLFNDYWDFKQGVDTDNYFRARYGPHPLISNLMSEKQLLLWAFATGSFAVIIALYLTVVRGPWVLAFTLAGSVFMMAYAGKPLPLKRIGLGEPVVFLTWGPLMIGGSYYVLTGQLPLWVLVASLPNALGVTSVLFGKHIDKIEDDTRKGIRTLPVLMGEKVARYASIVLIALMYFITFILIVAGYLSVWLLLVILALPLARQAVSALRKPRPSLRPEAYPKEAWPFSFVAFNFIHNRRFGSLFVAALVSDVLLRSAGLTLVFKLL